MKNKEEIIAIIILIVVGISYRLFPHPPNFSPVAAIALFSGFYFRRYFVLIPIVIMLVSDLFIGFYGWKLMIAVYGSFLLVGILGIMLRKNKSVTAIIGYSLSGSVLFFVLTNFAVWALGQWYAPDLSGLFRCYALALPFFKNTIAGDLFYSAAIFGAYELIAQPKEKLRFIFAKPVNKLN
jgi:hypothetical protein